MLLLFALSVQAYGQVLINEFSASNINGITNEDGDRCDWIAGADPGSEDRHRQRFEPVLAQAADRQGAEPLRQCLAVRADQQAVLKLWKLSGADAAVGAAMDVPRLRDPA